MKVLVSLLILTVTVVLFGCSDQPTAPVPTGQSEDDINQQDMPTPVEEMLARYAIPENELLRPLRQVDPPMTEFDVARYYDVYAVTCLWGELANTSAQIADTTDWSGTLWVNGVAVIKVLNEIDFEPGQDSVLGSNIPSSIGWVSQTNGDFDGLTCLVLLRRDIVYITPPVLTFQTEPITLQFYFDKLRCLDAFYPVDNENGVAIHARRIWPTDCPDGLVEGRWIKNGPFESRGVLYGWWMDTHGSALGHLDGTFWVNDDFSREFSATVSGLHTDEVIAELTGTWYYDDQRLCPICGEAHGVFEGTFVYLSDGHTGTIQGTFGDYSLPPDDPDMPFSGVWSFDCP